MNTIQRRLDVAALTEPVKCGLFRPVYIDVLYVAEKN